MWLVPDGVNPYKVDVTLPALPAGDYEVWVHNGHGGHFGWSGPLALTIAKNSAWASLGYRVYDVTAYGAKGDGVADDGEAVQAALSAAASNAPATVYFPAGIYAVSRAFEVQSNIRWLGAGRDLSTLKFTVPISQSGGRGFLYQYGDTENVLFEGITINADGQIDVAPYDMIIFDGRNIKFRNARLSSWGGQSFEIRSDGLFLEDVIVIGSGNFISSSSQVFITDTVFRMTNDGESAVASWGGHDIAFIGNELRNADESRSDGSGIGRLFVYQGHFGSTRNLYFGGNATYDSAPRDCRAVDCNKGEQIIWELGSVDLKGKASAVTGNTVRFDALDVPDVPGGTHVIVAGGRGVGQMRRILSVSGDTATLDRPWNVVPDTETSLFFVNSVAEKAVVYGNRFEGRTTHSQHDSNSTAVLVWGNCQDIIIANNDVSRMRHGIMVAATSGTARDSVSAPHFILVANNRIAEGNNGIYTGLTFGFDTAPGVYGGIGNVFRGNTVIGMSHIGIAFDTWDTSGGSFDATVFERNRVSNVRYGFITGLKLIWTVSPFVATPVSGTRLINTLLHENHFDRGIAPPAGSIGFRSDRVQTWLNRRSSWTGFAFGNGGP